MQSLIPDAIQPILKAYLDALDVERLGANLYGIYVYGSVALGAFDERTSDIDVITLTQSNLQHGDVERLETFHRRLWQEHALAKRMDVMYVPMQYLGRRNDEVPPYPYTADGEFHKSGHFDLNAVTWWLVKHKGIVLLGPEPQALPINVQWADVAENMRYNLDVYWERQRAGLSARSDVVLDDYSVLYSVSTLCRILSTLEDGEIPTKPEALAIWQDRLPGRFRRIVEEALRISRHSDAPSLYQTPAELREDVLRFMVYALERGKRALAN